MRYFNNSDIRYFRSKIQVSGGSTETIIKDSIMCGDIPDNFDVFLSYSKRDAEDVAPIIKFIEDFGVKVYIDPNGRDYTEEPSAQLLEKKEKQIRNCRKFMTLVTKETKAVSRWLPWELAFAEKEKSLSNIAVIVRSVSFVKPEWPDTDYFGFYPKVCFRDYEWMVCNRKKDKFVLLDSWFK